MSRKRALAWSILLAACIELTLVAVFCPGSWALLGLLGISVATYLLVDAYA